ncbi:MAG: toxin-antitoxin system YwqK family antitoxin [Salibacteraceae bacterium]
MKNYIYIILILLLFSCEESLSPKTIKSFQNGNPEIIEYYNQNNQLSKQEFYYPSGALKILGFYDGNGKKTGHWKSYYENGNIWSHNEYLNGEQHGLSEAFYEDGNLRYQGKYKQNKKTGEWCIYVKNGGKIDENCNSVD